MPCTQAPCAAHVNASLRCVLPEIELGKIAVKMLFIDVLIDADKAALQHGKEAFQVFVCAMRAPTQTWMINA